MKSAEIVCALRSLVKWLSVVVYDKDVHAVDLVFAGRRLPIVVVILGSTVQLLHTCG